MNLRRISLKEEKGSILFLIILFTAALLLLGTAFLRSSLQEKLIARNYTQKIRAHYLAEAGIEAALTLLQNQPDYFLHHSINDRIYIHGESGQGEDYFRLEWLEPGHAAGHEDCYTLKAYGHARSTFENKSARAEIKALLRIERTENEDNAEDENGTAGENGTEKISITLLHLSGR